MDTAVRQRGSCLGPSFAAAVAFLAFAFTSTTLPVPELSAGPLATALRLTPFPSMEHPLWGAIIRGLSALRPAWAVLLANGLSVLLGALSAGLLARLIEGSLRDRFSRVPAGWAQLAGVAAGLLFAASIPCWLVSNRAHPAALGLALLLASLNFIQQYRFSGSFPHLALGTVVYAVGLVEWPSMMLMAPLIAGHVVILLWQQRQLTGFRILQLALLLLVTPLLWWLMAWDYARLPAAAWREMDGVGEAFRYGLITYRDTLLHAVPRQGWLILLFTSVLPWLVAVFFVRANPTRLPSIGALLLLLLVSAVVLAILWNAPISPWALLDTQPLLVMPYVLIASAFAYLLAYASALFALRSATRGLTGFMALLLLLVWGVTLARSLPEVSTESARPIRRIVALLDEQLGDRDFVISQGILSDHQRLFHFQEGRAVTLLDAPLSDLSGYRRYLSSLFTEPRQRSLGLAGLMPVLVDWLASDSNVAARLAIEIAPDPWLSEGYEPLPLGGFFAGVREASASDVALVREEAARFWPLASAELKALRRTAPRLKHVADALAAHWSRVANDTGVFFEHRAQREAAREAYAQARQLDSGNICAAANLVVLGQAAGWTGIDVEEADLALAVAPRDRPLGSLVYQHGHLRRREAAQMLGAEVSLLADEEPDAAWNEAVAAYRRGNREEARRRLEKMLNERPEFDAAWILLASIAYEQGDETTLQKCVRHMREVRREWPEITVLLGRQALDRQDVASARDFFERAVQLRPSELAILELLMQLDLRDRDFRRAENRSRQMLAIRPDSIWGLLGLGSVLRHQQKLDLADDTLQRVVNLHRHPQALAELALTKEELGRAEEARTLAEEALERGPRVPATHEARGILYSREGQHERAAESFSRALSLDPQRWASRVYLAAALRQVGRLDESRSLVKQLRGERHPDDRELDDLLERLPE